MKNAVVHDKKFEQVAGAGTSVTAPAQGEIWTDIHNNVKSKKKKQKQTNKKHPQLSYCNTQEKQKVYSCNYNKRFSTLLMRISTHLVDVFQ